MAQDKAETGDGDVLDADQVTTHEPVYSAFNPCQKRWIIFLAAFTGMFSPMSSFIFYPAIDLIATGLNVSVGLVNIAITTYMVVSGIVPALLGNAADRFGRRPIYLLALSMYFVANLGLALQNSYAGLLVLRMLQSVGSSGTISLGYGIISDITTREERGSYVGILLLGPNVAPPVGPVIGGVLAAKLGWKWIFWILCIIGGACLALILLALPETSRVVVGNGSIPATGIYRTLISVITVRRKRPRMGSNTIPTASSTPKFNFPNPLACLKILALKDVLAVLTCNGIYYTIYCCLQASLSTLFIEIYHYQSLDAGLIYIPFGVACLISTFIWGRILDFDFARIAKQLSLSAEEARQQSNLGDFPIEKARLRTSLYLVVLSTIGTIVYGWVIHYRVHVAAPLVLQPIVGFATTGLFVALGTLLTDLNPSRASTAAASANLVRCALAATALAVLQPIINGIGVGWCFTIFGVLSGLCGPLMIWEIRCGGRIRQERARLEESA